MKRLTEEQVDDLLKLKFGKVVTEPGHTAYVSNAVLSKIFDVPTSTIAWLQQVRFEQHRQKNMPLMQKLKPLKKSVVPHQRFEGRKNFGRRFLKPHEVSWLVNAETLRLQTGVPLTERAKHFRRQFPGSSMNAMLLSRVYREHGVKRRRIMWIKQAREDKSA